MIALLLWIAAAQETPVEVARWIERLSSEEVEQREEAVRRLAALGPAARRALLPLRASADPELARLARQAIGHLDWDRYLPPHARNRTVLEWEALGAESLADYKTVLQKVVQESGYALGIPRRLQDEEDDERRKLLFLHAWISPFDPDAVALLKRWIGALDPDAFWNEGASFATQVFLYSRGSDRFEPAFWKPLLKSPARSRRYLAAWVLGERKDPDGLQALMEFVGDRNEQVANRAADLLASAGYAPARAALVADAVRSNGRSGSFYAMQQFGWKEDLDTLRKLLERLDDNALYVAHRMLLKEGDRSHLPDLLKKLAPSKDYLFMDHGAISAALLYDTEEAVDAVIRRLDADKSVSRHGDFERFNFGPNGQNLLWERFQKDSAEKTSNSRYGMYVHRYIPLSRGVELAREALSKPVPDQVLEFALRQMSLWSFRQEISEEDARLLRTIAKDRRDPQVSSAVRMLCSRKDREYRDILVARLDEARPEETLWALDQYGDPGLRAHFARFADPSQPLPIRIRAVEGLAHLPARESVATILEALHADSAELRDSALKHLELWPPALFEGHAPEVQKAYGHCKESYYVPALLDLLRRLDPPRAVVSARATLREKPRHPGLIVSALDAIRELGLQEDAPLAAAVLADPDLDGPTRIRAAEVLFPFQPDQALQGLIRVASERPEEPRATALRALGKTGRPEAARFLVDAAWSDLRTPASAAVEALGRMGGKPAQDFVRACAAESDRGRLVPASWPVAAALSRSADVLPSIRRRLEREPDREALWTADVIVHRADYDALPATAEETLKPASFPDACRGLARLCSLEAEISPALQKKFDETLASWREPRREDTSVGTDLTVIGGGRPEEALLRWSPKLVSTSTGGRDFFTFSTPFEWAHVLDGRRLRFVTPEEARELLKR